MLNSASKDPQIKFRLWGTFCISIIMIFAGMISRAEMNQNAPGAVALLWFFISWHSARGNVSSVKSTAKIAIIIQSTGYVIFLAIALTANYNPFSYFGLSIQDAAVAYGLPLLIWVVVFYNAKFKLDYLNELSDFQSIDNETPKTDAGRLEESETRLYEDQEIQLVIEEMKDGNIDEVAMAKAVQQSKGDKEYAKSLYINERIRRKKDIFVLENADNILLEEREAKLSHEVEVLKKQKSVIEKEIKHLTFWTNSLVITAFTLTIFLFFSFKTTFALYGLIITVLLIVLASVLDAPLKKRLTKVSEELEAKIDSKKSKISLFQFLILTLISLIVLWFLMGSAS